MSNVSFTVEEQNLLAMFQREDKEAMLKEVLEMRMLMNDPGMKEIMDSAVAKLKAVPEEDFPELAFFVADDIENE